LGASEAKSKRGSLKLKKRKVEERGEKGLPPKCRWAITGQGASWKRSLLKKSAMGAVRGD